MHEQQADNIRPYDIVGAIHELPALRNKKRTQTLYYVCALFTSKFYIL